MLSAIITDVSLASAVEWDRPWLNDKECSGYDIKTIVFIMVNIRAVFMISFTKRLYGIFLLLNVSNKLVVKIVKT